MNNKKIGTDFERDFVKLLATEGFWAHFIAPDRRGAQPFDVIAAKDGTAFAFDCKTCASETFSIDRLEDNQIAAFERWMACGNMDPYIAIKHRDGIYLLPYSVLKRRHRIKVKEALRIDD